jgi:hypothetical protein
MLQILLIDEYHVNVMKVMLCIYIVLLLTYRCMCDVYKHECLTRTPYSYTAAIIRDRHDWMYESFNKGGCHTREWFAKTQMFLDHAAALSQIDKLGVHAINVEI